MYGYTQKVTLKSDIQEGGGGGGGGCFGDGGGGGGGGFCSSSCSSGGGGGGSSRSSKKSRAVPRFLAKQALSKGGSLALPCSNPGLEGCVWSAPTQATLPLYRRLRGLRFRSGRVWKMPPHRGPIPGLFSL